MIEFTAVTGALTALKTISDIAKNVNSSELMQKVIDLQNSILDLQKELLALQTENMTLKGEKLSLEEIIDKEHQLVFTEDTYWRKLAMGYDGPYCGVCWDSEHKLVHLTNLGTVMLSRSGPTTRYYCSKHNVSTVNVPAPRVQQILSGNI